MLETPPATQHHGAGHHHRRRPIARRSRSTRNAGPAANVIEEADAAQARAEPRRRHPRHPAGDQPADRAEPRPHQPADLARRPRAADGHAARRRQPARERADRARAPSSRAPPARRSAAASRRSSTSTRASGASSRSTSGRRAPSCMVTDLVGRQLASVTSFPTERDPKRFIAGLAKRVKAVLAEHTGPRPLRGRRASSCRAWWSRRPASVLLRAEPRMARSQPARSARRRARPAGPDRELRQGVRAGAALGRAARRRRPATSCTSPCRTASASASCSAASSCAGSTTSAASSATCRLNIDGPRCGCGATGCWEAYVSNLATLSRYFGRDLRDRPRRRRRCDLADRRRPHRPCARRRRQGARGPAVDGTVSRPRPRLGGECHRPGARLHRRRDHRPRGISSRPPFAPALAERALTPSAGATPITIVPPEQYPRLRGAAALVAAAVVRQGIASHETSRTARRCPRGHRHSRSLLGLRDEPCRRRRRAYGRPPPR